MYSLSRLLIRRKIYAETNLLQAVTVSVPRFCNGFESDDPKAGRVGVC